MRKVLVICPNSWDREGLAHPSLRHAVQPVFAGAELLETPRLWDALRFDIFRYAQQLTELGRREKVEGVVGTGDYPGSMLAALVASQLGLPGARADTVTLLSHKLYSRELQQRLLPEATPAFGSLDPYAPREPLPYPMFIKPVKGTMSIRASLVTSRRELKAALRFGWRERMRAHLLLRPFQQLLDRYSDRRSPAHFFIAEQPLQGAQVTVDGFLQHGRATIMGVVDSVMYPGTGSFERFEYPSALPGEVQERMRALVVRLMEGSGLDHSCFNVELFYDPADGSLRVIEINPRMSYQFADLYERVDGSHTYAVQAALATGAPAPWRAGSGRDGAAASFVLRRFSDAKVVAVPTEVELAQLDRDFPGATVKVLCAPGERLSHHDQDVGSFRYAIVNLGAPTRAELFERYAQFKARLRFAFDPPEAPRPTAALPRAAAEGSARRTVLD